MRDAIADLRRYLVQVLDGLGEGVEGTGFVCDGEGYALTCWHVVSGWGERGLKGEVRWQGRRVPAELVVARSVEAADLAVLKLGAVEGGPVEGAWPVLPLEVQGRLRLQDALRSFGYPQGQFDQSGIPIRGEIGGLEAIRIGGVEALPIAGLNLDNVDAGYSGAPVLDERTQKVIGLVHAKQHGTQAFIVPLAPLFAAWPELRTAHDVFERIRRQLGAQAQAALDEKLHAAPFIPLRLEGGRIEERAEDGRGKADAQPHHRTWEAFDLKDLLPLRGRFILSADVGTGKTTFVQWLAAELVRRTHQVPVVMACEQLERLAPKSLDDLLAAVAERLPDTFLSVDREEALADAHGKGRLVFLFDGLDQISGERPSEVAKLAFSLAGHAPVLISSRPSAVNRALEGDRQLTFLRLQPFSVRDQRQYFGARYETVKAVCALAPELTQVPMLAYMVRELAAAGTLPKEATRTELYGQFVRHVLTEHEGNVSLQDKPGLIDKVEPVLAKLAYDALAAARPHIQRVPVSVYTDDGRVPLRDLIAFGLVNRLLGRGEEVLYFTHQSFQEYLAAKHAASRPESVDQILTERWHPKWAEVIRFLAGLNGEDVLDRILAGPDNVIHSNLLLAARCAGEIRNLSPQCLGSLKAELYGLAEIKPFRELAIRALGSLGRWLDAADDRRFVDWLDESGEEEAGPFPQAEKLPEAASAALGGLGRQLDASAAAALLRRLLQSDHPQALDALPRVISWLDSGTVSEIVERLHDPSRLVRMRACDALGKLADRLHSDQISGLLRLLRDEREDAHVRLAAARALCELGDTEHTAVIGALIASLKDHNVHVRSTAALGLSNASRNLDRKAVSSLLERLQDRDGPARYVARAISMASDRLDATALVQFVDWLLATSLISQGDFADAFATMAKRLDEAILQEVVSRVRGALSSLDKSRCAAAVRALGSFGQRLDPADLASLVERVHDKDVGVRLAAIEALGKLGNRLDSNVIAELLERLRDTEEHEDVQIRIVRVLVALRDLIDSTAARKLIEQVSKIGALRQFRATVSDAFLSFADRLDAAGIQALSKRLNDSDPYVRVIAAQALAKARQPLDGSTVLLLKDMLYADDEEIRCAAAEALGDMPEQLEQAAIAALEDRLRTKENLGTWATGIAAVWSLQRLSATTALVTALEHEDGKVRDVAAGALGRIEHALDSRAVAALLERLRSDDFSLVRADAAHTLGALGRTLNATAKAALVELLGDKICGSYALAALSDLYRTGAELPDVHGHACSTGFIMRSGSAN